MHVFAVSLMKIWKSWVVHNSSSGRANSGSSLNLCILLKWFNARFLSLTIKEAVPPFRGLNSLIAVRNFYNVWKWSYTRASPLLGYHFLSFRSIPFVLPSYSCPLCTPTSSTFIIFNLIFYFVFHLHEDLSVSLPTIFISLYTPIFFFFFSIPSSPFILSFDNYELTVYLWFFINSIDQIFTSLPLSPFCSLPHSLHVLYLSEPLCLRLIFILLMLLLLPDK